MTPFSSSAVMTISGSISYSLTINGGNWDSSSTRITAPESMEIESIQYTANNYFYGNNYMRIYDGSNNMLVNIRKTGNSTITDIIDRSSVAIGLYRNNQSIGGADSSFSCSYTITFRKKSS